MNQTAEKKPTREQERAAHSWEMAKQGVEQHGKDYVNDAKSLPALIMNSGLMQVMAYMEGKSDRRYQTLATHLRDWLHQSLKTPSNFEPFMQHLLKAEPREFQAITAEAYAWLRWLRQMAPAVAREGAE